ncbi:Arm DNA-binding domain-containing protein [Legionella quinlivanii]
MSIKTIQKIKNRKPDGEGLFLRIRPNGAKSWLFCFRIGKDPKTN